MPVLKGLCLGLKFNSATIHNNIIVCTHIITSQIDSIQSKAAHFSHCELILKWSDCSLHSQYNGVVRTPDSD